VTLIGRLLQLPSTRRCLWNATTLQRSYELSARHASRTKRRWRACWWTWLWQRPWHCAEVGRNHVQWPCSPVATAAWEAQAHPWLQSESEKKRPVMGAPKLVAHYLWSLLLPTTSRLLGMAALGQERFFFLCLAIRPTADFSCSLQIPCQLCLLLLLLLLQCSHC